MSEIVYEAPISGFISSILKPGDEVGSTGSIAAKTWMEAIDEYYAGKREIDPVIGDERKQILSDCLSLASDSEEEGEKALARIISPPLELELAEDEHTLTVLRRSLVRLNEAHEIALSLQEKESEAAAAGRSVRDLDAQLRQAEVASREEKFKSEKLVRLTADFMDGVVASYSNEKKLLEALHKHQNEFEYEKQSLHTVKEAIAMTERSIELQKAHVNLGVVTGPSCKVIAVHAASGQWVNSDQKLLTVEVP